MFSMQNLLLKIRTAVCASTKNKDPNQGPTPTEENPWQRNLERLAEERGADCQKVSGTQKTVEEQFQVLIEQAKMEKTKESLRKQQEALQKGGNKSARIHDKTVTDAKAWWGNSVATWDPEDSKNVTFQDQKLPKQHKWFNQ